MDEMLQSVNKWARQGSGAGMRGGDMGRDGGERRN